MRGSGIYIKNLVHNSITGQMRYATIPVIGTTDPLDSDADDGGILDEEEIDLGTDDWSANPVITDIDNDGVSDYGVIPMYPASMGL